MTRSEGGKQRWHGLTLNRGAAVTAAVCLALAACAGHQAGPTAGPPPTYPPIAPGSVQMLSQRPPVAYDELGTVTVQDESVKPLAETFNAVRQLAAQAGANAAVLLTQETFGQHNGVTGRRTNMRRLVALLIRRKDIFTPPVANPQNLPMPARPSPSPRIERGGGPPPHPMGAPPGATGT